MLCPSCHEQNDPLALVCFQCEWPLTGHAIHRGKVVGGRYEILQWLGRGGMGAVYQAFDRVLEEEVAIKILRAEVAASSDVTRRFRSEIKLARKVRQPNVCAIHEYGEDGDLRFISMELIDGTDLKHALQTSGRFEIDEAFGITRQIAEGLKAIHAIGVIHRDLKASNIMLDRRRQAHVMDFGIAKQFGPEAAASATLAGHILGTPEYMSPEQARGQPLDPRTDIYALGILMFEIFTGQVPFQGETPVATLFKQLQDPPPVNDARLPGPLSAVLGKALAKNAEDRYANVADFIEALDFAQGTIRGSEDAESPNVATVAEQPALRIPAPTIVPATTVVPSFTRSGTVTPPAPSPPPHLETTIPPSSPPRAVPLPLPVPSPPAVRTPPPSRSGLRALAAAAALVLVVIGAALIARRPSRPAEGEPEHDARARPATATPPPAIDGVEALSSTASAGAVASAVPSPAASRLATTLDARAEVAGRTAFRSSPSAPAVSPPAPRPAPVTTSVTIPSAPTGGAAIGGASAAEDSGLLQIVARPWADITVDGAAVGTTPFRALKMSPGKHIVVFRHPDYKPFQRQIVVQSGQTARLEVDLSWEAFRK